MRRLSSQLLYVGLATFDIATPRHALAVVNAVGRVDGWSRAAWILTIKLGFDPFVKLIQIQSIVIGFD